MHQRNEKMGGIVEHFKNAIYLVDWKLQKNILTKLIEFIVKLQV